MYNLPVACIGYVNCPVRSTATDSGLLKLEPIVCCASTTTGGACPKALDAVESVGPLLPNRRIRLDPPQIAIHNW